MLSTTGGATGGLHSPALLVKTQDSYLSQLAPGNNTPTGPVESTPFVFNGQIYTITANTNSGAYAGSFRIDAGLARPLRNVSAPDMERVCVYVENGTCYAFGSSTDHSCINMMSSTDLVTWTAPVSVFATPPGMGFYNLSVDKVSNGSYVMAVECTDQGYPGIPFITRFLTGTSLTAWSIDTTMFYNNGVFTNCPTIRYLNGYYYLFYMSSAGGVYYTFVSRSTDLKAWVPSSGGVDGLTVPLAPLVTEGTNNSDMDLVEFNGQLFFVFARGDQTSWLEISTAVYPGTLAEYLMNFF